MTPHDPAALRAAIAALEAQRAVLGDGVLELALAPLRALLAAAQRPLALQHRQVTVLFADVAGSTALAQGLDAEDTLAVLNTAMRSMATLIEAHQGRVLRFTGDGVKAAFGMDQAREDDPERAVRTGLAILQATAEQARQARLSGLLNGAADFAVRVGVHTGDVALGAGIDADNTAMGVAVHIAARMEQTAPAGALRISHDTWALVRGLFDAEPQPPLSVKGVAEPMQTYLVRGALDRSVASVERGLQGLHTPLVGRQAELQRLVETVARARQTRQLQPLTLLGDAGLGKSRLLRELQAALAREPGATRVLAVRAQPDGQLRPWGLLRSLLAAQCGVADTDSAELARRKLVDGLAPWFSASGESGESGVRQAQLIGQLAGLDFGDSLRGLDARSLRDQAFAAWRAWLQALAVRSDALPLLLVEDLHWADDSSLDWLQHLLAHASALPVALVMTSRPALLTRRPDWGQPADRVTLSPLAAAHSDELLQALLQRMDAVPQSLSDLLVRRAEGNPYYLEELVRRLIDDGVIATDGPRWTAQTDRLQTVRLPGTLVGLLQARLDALPAEERQAARQASVIGHVFWDDALQALDAQAPQALPALQRAAFVRDHATSDFAGTAERQFDHHLLHQVTYDTLLKAERRLGHGAAARWLLARTQGRGAEFLAMTGEHAERAGDLALAADCFEQAGREAGKRFANSAAVAWWRRALSLLGESDPPRRFDLLSDLGRIADTVGDRAEQDALHQEQAALLERHPDDRRRAHLCFAQALLADRRSDAATSERLARQAFALAEGSCAAQWAAMAQGQLAWLCIAREDYLQAVRHVETGLPWARQIDAEVSRAETEAQLLTLSAMVSMQTSRLNEARGTLTAVLSRGETLGKPRLQLGALDNLAIVAAYLGRWEEVTAWSERALALAQSIGARSDAASALHRLAQAAQKRGDLSSAMRHCERAVATLHAVGNRRVGAVSLRHLGSLHLDTGDAQAAWQALEQSLALQQGQGEVLETADLGAWMALCEQHLGRTEAALARVDALLAGLDGDLAGRPPHQTLELRWLCHQVLEAQADARAAPLLEQLHADVQARAVELTDAADRERLIQALPVFRGVVAAHARPRAGPGPVAG